MTEGHARPLIYDKQMGEGREESSPEIRKLPPFCLLLAGLLGDSWPREPPHRASHLSNAEKCATSQFCQVLVKTSACREALCNHQRKQSTRRGGCRFKSRKRGGPASHVGRNQGSRKAAVKPSTCALHSQGSLPRPEGSPRQTRAQATLRRGWGVYMLHHTGSKPQP